MNGALFKPHGDFAFAWHGDVLYSRLVGTFNREAIANYLREMRETVATRPGITWGRIADMRAWDGATPDATDMAEELATWIKQSQCIVSVQVFSERFFQAVAAQAAKRVSPRNLKQVFTMAAAVEIMREYELSLGDDPEALLKL